MRTYRIYGTDKTGKKWYREITIKFNPWTFREMLDTLYPGWTQCNLINNRKVTK